MSTASGLKRALRRLVNMSLDTDQWGQNINQAGLVSVNTVFSAKVDMTDIETNAFITLSKNKLYFIVSLKGTSTDPTLCTTRRMEVYTIPVIGSVFKFIRMLIRRARKKEEQYWKSRALLKLVKSDLDYNDKWRNKYDRNEAL